MANPIQKEFQTDLLSRGYSRRQMLNAAALLGSASALGSLSSEAAWAADAPMQAPKVRIGTNECWTGPMPAGLAALNAVGSQCNRYNPSGEPAALVRAIAQTEKIPEDHISVWPGAYSALARAVIAFCSPTKGLVTCDPAYETPGEAAAWLSAPYKAVPLRASDYSHDVKAMLAANPNAGLYYICNPNNPTATMTSMADIEWLVDNKPTGSIVVIDEAYIHWTRDYPNNTATHLAIANKDVMVFGRSRKSSEWRGCVSVISWLGRTLSKKYRSMTKANPRVSCRSHLSLVRQRAWRTICLLPRAAKN